MFAQNVADLRICLNQNVEPINQSIGDFNNAKFQIMMMSLMTRLCPIVLDWTNYFNAEGISLILYHSYCDIVLYHDIRGTQIYTI